MPFLSAFTQDNKHLLDSERDSCAALHPQHYAGINGTTESQKLTTRDKLEQIAETTFLILVSFAAFRVLQLLVRWYLYRKWTFKTFNFFEFVRRRRISKPNRPVPDSQALDIVPPNKRWRSSNEIVSLIHSAISGFWALYVLTTYYDKFKEECGLITYSHPIAEYLILMSFGYLAEDLLDLLINERSVRIIELLFHHTVVISAFIVTLVTRYFLGVVVIGLLMEINSIFLHTRSLMNLNGVKKNSYSFRLIALLNIATFIAFRMVVSLFLIVWQFSPSTLSKVPWYLVLINGVVILSLASTNTVLLYRVLAADGVLGKKRARRHNSADHHHRPRQGSHHSHGHHGAAANSSGPTNPDEVMVEQHLQDLNRETFDTSSYSSDADNEDNIDEEEEEETTTDENNTNPQSSRVNGRNRSQEHNKSGEEVVGTQKVKHSGTQSTVVGAVENIV